MLAIYVAIGGAIGSLLRYGMMGVIGRTWRADFPLATLAVNVLGSFVMGLLVGWLARAMPPAAQELRLLLGVGLLDGFTTFSAFSLDAVALIERGQWGMALTYAAVSVVFSIAGLLAGLSLWRVAAA